MTFFVRDILSPKKQIRFFETFLYYHIFGTFTNNTLHLQVKLGSMKYSFGAKTKESHLINIKLFFSRNYQIHSSKVNDKIWNHTVSSHTVSTAIKNCSFLWYISQVVLQRCCVKWLHRKLHVPECLFNKGIGLHPATSLEEVRTQYLKIIKNIFFNIIPPGKCFWLFPLRKTCQNTGFVLPIFFCIWTDHSILF